MGSPQSVTPLIPPFVDSGSCLSHRALWNDDCLAATQFDHATAGFTRLDHKGGTVMTGITDPQSPSLTSACFLDLT